MSIEVGNTVKYKTEVDGKPRSGTGVVHGVRKADTPTGPKIISYLVDTGDDNSTEERHIDHRGLEITRRVVKLAEKNKKIKTDDREFAKAVAQIDENDSDLPEAGVEVVVVRQPELVDVRPDDIIPV